jgi:hypothetical protein
MRNFDGGESYGDDGWGARGGVNATPPRRGSSRRAHHRLTGYRSRSSQSLILTSSHVATRPLCVASALSRFEVHGNFPDVASYRREDFTNLSVILSLQFKEPSITPIQAACELGSVSGEILG